ncbi:protein FAM [Clarias magur]|uniref:Protein FAM n=1 Tax=Clarias magur TaxID=1594786 RepID=A0A8J4TSE3_CLAMG|nr:protein FAM [Clarias magur]
MSVETLRPSDGRLAFTSAMPLRILNKGPDYFRRILEPGARKLSAVERLEADKAKYVKSQQVALTRQEPIKPPVIRKPLMSPAMMLHTPPARKVPRRPSDTENGGQGPCRATPLNLDALNNLINISDVPHSSSPAPNSPSPSTMSGQSAEPQQICGFNGHFLLKPASSCTSSLLNSHVQPSSLASPTSEPSHRPPPVPARVSRVPVQSNYSSRNPVTVRRVDVRPQAEIRKPQRMPLQSQSKPLQPQPKPRQTPQPQAPPPPTPSFKSPSLPLHSSSSPCVPSSPLLLRAAMLPPASPACTRLSSTSSRGSARRRPSLHRSKSDLSDRYAQRDIIPKAACEICSASSIEESMRRKDLHTLAQPHSQQAAERTGGRKQVASCWVKLTVKHAEWLLALLAQLQIYNFHSVRGEINLPLLSHCS